jgi:hypothetical protein
MTVLAHFIKSYYAYTMDHDVKMTINFWNSSYGEVETGLTDVYPIHVEKWPIIKVNEDQWLRPTYFKESSWFSDENYTLTRIVKADGLAHPIHWPEFVQYMGQRNLRVFDSDVQCKRTCHLTVGICWLCNFWCRDSFFR